MTEFAGAGLFGERRGRGRFAVTVAFTLRPEQRARFLTLVLKNADASLKTEAGCFCFDVLEPIGTNGPDVLLYEIYADRAAFDAHLASSHFLAFDAATRDMVLSKAIAEFRVEAPSERPLGT